MTSEQQPLLLPPKPSFTFSSWTTHYISRLAAAAAILTLLAASNAGYAYAAIQKVDEMNQNLDAKIQMIESMRNQRFSSSSSYSSYDNKPLDKLFSMHKARKENLGSQISELLEQARAHTEARKKVEEELHELQKEEEAARAEKNTADPQHK